MRQGAEEGQPAQAHGGPALGQRSGLHLPVLQQALPHGQLALEPLVAVPPRAHAGCQETAAAGSRPGRVGPNGGGSGERQGRAGDEPGGGAGGGGLRPHGARGCSGHHAHAAAPVPAHGASRGEQSLDAVRPPDALASPIPRAQ